MSHAQLNFQQTIVRARPGTDPSAAGHCRTHHLNISAEYLRGRIWRNVRITFRTHRINIPGIKEIPSYIQFKRNLFTGYSRWHYKNSAAAMTAKPLRSALPCQRSTRRARFTAFACRAR